MKIKRVYLDKHLSVFGAVSTLSVGQQHIEEIEVGDFGAIVTFDNKSLEKRRKILVPWTSIKNCEIEETPKRALKKASSSD